MKFAVDYSTQVVISTSNVAASATLPRGWWLMGVAGVPCYVASAAGSGTNVSVTSANALVPVGFEDQPKFRGSFDVQEGKAATKASDIFVTYAGLTSAGTGQLFFVRCYNLEGS